VFGHLAGLVPLQLADEVPGERPPAQRLDLGDALADVVLAKLLLAGVGRRGDRLDRLLLAHRQQPHGGRVAPGAAGRRLDPRQHGLEPLGRELRSG